MHKFTVIAGNQVLYRGADGSAAAAVVAKAVMLTEQKLKAVAAYVYEEWKSEVRSSERIPQPDHSWRDVDYRQDYLRGIKPPMVARGTLRLELSDTAALKVEAGWVPPHSADERDGIGGYDGSVHDLRPWLFSFGTIHTVKGRSGKDGSTDKRNKNRGKRYRNLRFITPQMSKQIDALLKPFVDSLHDEEHDEQTRNRIMRNAKRSVAAAYHEAIVNIPFTRRYTMTGAKLAHEATAELHHVHWIYHKARPYQTSKGSYGGWMTHRDPKRVANHMKNEATRFKTFRTIFENADDQNPGAFFTRGIKPANLITGKRAPVAIKLRQAIRNVIAGKNPDGTDGN